MGIGAAITAFLSSLLSIRALMYFLIVTVIGVVLYNLTVDIVTEVENFALSRLSGVSSPTMPSLGSISGFAAWIAGELKINQCISVVTSVISLKWILRKIPFLHW